MSKRLFIAIKPNTEILQGLKSFQDQLKQALPYNGIRWVDPKLIHLTVQFLGETDDKLLLRLVSSLDLSLKGTEAFEQIFQGTGTFGSGKSVRVIWIGALDTLPLRDLHKRVLEATDLLHLEQRSRLSPHLTLARISDRTNSQERYEIFQHMRGLSDPFFGSQEVSSIELVESVLTGSGPVYKTYHRFDFG